MTQNYDEYNRIIEELLDGATDMPANPWGEPYSEEADRFWWYANTTEHFEALLAKVRNYEYRNYIALTAEGREIELRNTRKGFARYCGNTYLGVLSDDFFRVRNINIHDGVMHVEGAIGFYGVKENTDVIVRLTNNRKHIIARTTDRDHIRPHGISMRMVAFRCDVPLDSAKENLISFTVRLGRTEIKYGKLIFDRYAPLDNKLKSSYFCCDKWCVTYSESNLIVKRLPALGRSVYTKGCENRLREEIRQSYPDKYEMASRYRNEARSIRKRAAKPIVLFSDRIMSADDNAEALFKYAVTKNDIEAYFVVDGRSADYTRMQQYGKVLDQKSEQYRIMVLAAHAIVASQASEVFRNPFGEDSIFFKDMLHTPFILTVHGVSHGKDSHSWFCRTNRMIDCMMVGGRPEYDQFTLPEYGFQSDEVAVTGLPRFDYLEDKSQNIITVMPTWREYLTDGQDVSTGLWKLCYDFRESEHATFNRNLMESERLRAAADKYGYKLQFKVHPCFAGEDNAYGFKPDVAIVDNSKSYRDIFAESSLIVTDYSSVTYDFVYIKKPVVYTQYDAQEMDARHSYQTGYGFAYEKCGFGEVETTLEGTIDRLIEYMANGCVLKPEYEARACEFFGTIDKNNCERAYDAMLVTVNRLR